MDKMRYSMEKVKYSKPEKMFPIKRVSKMLGVTTYTVRNWARDKKIKAVKIPDNSQQSQWFIPESEIERLKGETE